jgi:hypothetical protein
MRQLVTLAWPTGFELDLKDASSRGVRLEAVEPDSVAWRDEMMVGDLIADVEGRQVRLDPECLAAIRTALLKLGLGGFQIERQGRRAVVFLKARSERFLESTLHRVLRRSGAWLKGALFDVGTQATRGLCLD